MPERGFYPHAIDQASHPGPHRSKVAEKYNLWYVKGEENKDYWWTPLILVTGIDALT